MAKAISGEIGFGRIDATAVALSDTALEPDLQLQTSVCGGSRTRYVWEVQQAVLNHSHFLYDFVGMARAHCRFPFLRRPFLVWIHGIEVWERTHASWLASTRRARFLVANSRYSRDRAEHLHGGFSNAECCWLATEMDQPPTGARLHDGPPTVLLLGRFDDGGGYKGHKELIACWPAVVSSVPEARLVFVGRGPGQALMRDLAGHSPAASQIQFRGFIPDEAMAKVWAETSVFAMPSRGEGFGLVYIEAMRQGVPVLASVHDAAPEINLDGVTGFNVNLDNKDELPERLIFLLRNRDLATELGHNGQLRWSQEFRYSRFRDRFLPILRKFLNT